MASPTTPMHGKLGAIYRMRPNGFKGAGLNDATWGTAFNGADSAYFEVVIDGEGAPDTFKWRKDGGAWTETVAITGAAQTLSDAQTITFAADTGHTAADQWVIGNLKDEPTTEAASDAQITDATMRLLNPNAVRTWTDDGGKVLLIEDCTRGKGTFSGAVGNVTVTGNNGFIVAGSLEMVGWLIDWGFSVECGVADISSCGDKWRTHVPGSANCRGSANAFLIASDSFLDEISAGVEDGENYVLLELFNYDPDQDQTGDHFLAWATLSGLGDGATLNEAVKEAVTFEVHGVPSFVENV